MYPVLILCPGRRDPLPCPLPGYGHHQTYPRLKGIIPTRDTPLGCIFMFHRCRRIFLIDQRVCPRHLSYRLYVHLVSSFFTFFHVSFGRAGDLNTYGSVRPHWDFITYLHFLTGWGILYLLFDSNSCFISTYKTKKRNIFVFPRTKYTTWPRNSLRAMAADYVQSILRS